MDNRLLLNSQLDRLDKVANDIASANISEFLSIIKTRRAQVVKETYADLLKQARYKKAVNFLADDLLGGNNLGQRGSDLKKAKSAMTRMLPDALLGTVARSVEFTAVTLEIESAVALQFKAKDIENNVSLFDQHIYAAVRSAVKKDHLLHQSELVLMIGKEIESVVNRPFVSTALKMCRKPAKLIGLSELQDFLERGFESFKEMRGSQQFLRLFKERETALIESIYKQANT